MLLLIDTSGDTATVILSAAGQQLAFSENAVTRDHSAWLHPAIRTLLQEVNMGFQMLEAVAVTSGPGSYTGLRVGMAAAKGICYALRIPLITCNNLLLTAGAMLPDLSAPDQLLCPMIDARRLEVYTALYSRDLKLIRPPAAVILDKTSFETELSASSILFGGSGAAKWAAMCFSVSAAFIVQPDIKQSFIQLASESFTKKEWADTAYAEPEYGKEFHTHVII